MGEAVSHEPNTADDEFAIEEEWYSGALGLISKCFRGVAV